MDSNVQSKQALLWETGFKHDPDFESLRDHPRFQAIVKRIAPS